MGDYYDDSRTVNTWDTYGQDTFAEASVSESGPSPNEDEFTQYGDHPSTSTKTDEFTVSPGGADDYTTSQYTNSQFTGSQFSDDPSAWGGSRRSMPTTTGPSNVDGPYYDEDGRPYYIDENGEPYYDDSFDPSKASSAGYNPAADTGGAMMMYDPNMAIPEEDEDEDYDDYDEGVPLADDYLYDDEYDDDDEERARRARRRRAWCCCLILLCCLLLLIILLILWLLDWGNEVIETTPAPTYATYEDYTDDDFYYDDDITLSPGFITSCMADFDGNCKFMDQACFPNVEDQCNCRGAIEIVPADVVAMRDLVMDRVARKFFGANWTMPLDSCEPLNMAMIWLASGNNRDAGEARQRFILAYNYYQLNGTVWDYPDGWMSEMNECLWLGIQCNNRDTVNSYALDTNNIFGEFPTEIGIMEGLASISISRVHLSGTIPSEIFTMPRLKELRMYSNRMRGWIPTEIGLSSKLRTLRLETNFLNGNIPSEIGLTTALTDLDLGFNSFSGSVPTEIGQLKRLINLRMPSNRLSGTLPSEIGRMDELKVFTITENLLHGTIPSYYGLMWKLRDFRMSATGVGGFLPTELRLLSDLQRFEFGYNNFQGTLLTEFGELTDLCKFETLRVYMCVCVPKKTLTIN